MISNLQDRFSKSRLFSVVVSSTLINALVFESTLSVNQVDCVEGCSVVVTIVLIVIVELDNVDVVDKEDEVDDNKYSVECDVAELTLSGRKFVNLCRY